MIDVFMKRVVGCSALMTGGGVARFGGDPFGGTELTRLPFGAMVPEKVWANGTVGGKRQQRVDCGKLRDE